MPIHEKRREELGQLKVQFRLTEPVETEWLKNIAAKFKITPNQAALGILRAAMAGTYVNITVLSETMRVRVGDVEE